jgi:hypothetical protein
MAKPDSASSASQADFPLGRKHFTVEEARRALPLVKRIAADIQVRQANRVRLHAQLASEADDPLAAPSEARQIERSLDLQTNRLEELIEELAQVGVELKDPARGLVDFPALFQGREILLCWRPDETTINAWHELDTGYAGRRSLDELKKT